MKIKETLQSYFNDLRPSGKVPPLVWVFQGILLSFLLLYAIMVWQGGTFSSFYAWIAACVACAVALLLSLFQRRWLLAALDLAAGILVFLHLFTLPF